MAEQLPPHEVFKGLGQPESVEGDSTYTYKGQMKNLPLPMRLLGLLGKAFSNKGAETGGNNPMAQPINKVSEVPSTRDFNQTNMVDEQAGPQDDYSRMMSMMGDKYGQSPEQMEDLMNRIAYHETGPGSRMDPRTVQAGGGPGRGLFQFEAGEGQGGHTAMRRLHHWYDKQGLKRPNWTDIGSDDRGIDASQYAPEMQKMLFMANVLQHPSASLKGVNPDNLGQFWQDYHYAGPQDKRELFGDSMAAYNLKNMPSVEEQAFNY